MKLKIHGEHSTPKIRQILFEQFSRLEDQHAIRFAQNITLFITPTNGFGEPVVAIDNCGREIQLVQCNCPYPSAADQYDINM